MRFYTGAEWGRPPWAKPVTRVGIGSRRAVMGHYSTGQELGRDDCVEWVRDIDRDHRRRGWAGVGYNYLACRHGDVFEGRGRDLVGAHCPDWNTAAVGICYLGNDDPDDVDATPEAKLAMRTLVLDIDGAAGRTLTRLGHRDKRATKCPGDELYGWWHGGLVVPGPAPTPPAPHSPAIEIPEADVQPNFMLIHLDSEGNGHDQWDIGRPVRGCGATRQGPFPPTDDYWYEGNDRVKSSPIPAVQPRGNVVVVSVEGGKPNGTCGVWVFAV